MPLSGTDRRRVRGHLHDVAPAAFVQMIAIERETCALVVREDGREGVLSFVAGDLWDARLGDLQGEEAAVRILGWDLAHVETRVLGDAPPRSINAPLTFVLLESMRRRDEGSAGPEDAAAAAVSAPAAAVLAPLLHELEGVHGACLIDFASGRSLEEHFPEASGLDSAEVVRASHGMAHAGQGLALRTAPPSALEEVVLTFGDGLAVLRLLHADLLLAIVADPARTTLPAIHAAVRRLAPPAPQPPSSWQG